MTESKREDLRYGRHELIFETVRQSLEEAAEVSAPEWKYAAAGWESTDQR